MINAIPIYKTSLELKRTNGKGLKVRAGIGFVGAHGLKNLRGPIP